MPPFPPANLADWPTPDALPDTPPDRALRLFSIWEITTWILPMAPEHFRRVLAAMPHLPQGSAGAEGGTRWFSAADLAALRGHFAQGPRQARYQPQRPPHAVAPIITLTGPLGGMGRTTALLHLAVAGALSGYKILVIEGDAAGSLGRILPVSAKALPPGHGTGGAAEPGPSGQGALSLLARSAARHLRALNQARLDRGDAPQPMDDRLAAALPLTAAELIRPSSWPGLDVMPMTPQALLADGLIAGWRHALRGWHPARALGTALQEDGLRQHYDLILCDTPRGLGPLALALLGAADTLLAPLPLGDEGALPRLTAGLQALGQAQVLAQAEAQAVARALGQVPIADPGQHLLILPTRTGPDAARQMAGFAAKLGEALLQAPLPEVQAVAAAQVGHLYDLDYRSLGRLAYAPLRQACDAACRNLLGVLTGFAAKP